MKHILFVVVILFIILLTGCNTKNISDADYEQKGIDYLENEGYEVIDLSYSDTNAILKMKTFGEREDQVLEAFTFLEVWYPNASTYKVQISSSGKDCYYEIDGHEYRNLSYEIRTKKNNVNIVVVNRLEELQNSGVCY